jgi:hypothetical protein
MTGGNEGAEEEETEKKSEEESQTCLGNSFVMTSRVESVGSAGIEKSVGFARILASTAVMEDCWGTLA